MTKKDFILIANILKRAKLGAQENEITENGLEWLAEVFCVELRKINSRFDEQRFKNEILK